MRIRRRRLRDALVAVGCLVAAVEPFGAPGDRVRFSAALVLLATGSLLHFWSKGCLEQNQRLVTAGPYRFTRNPFYLANGLIDLGLCTLIGRVWIAVPYLVLWAIAYRDTICREEERLAALFPGEFERYVSAVPRLIPSGRSLPRAEAAGEFTLANPALAEGSEYARILGVWVAAATIGAWAFIRVHGLEIFAPEQTAGLGLVTLVAVAWVAKLALAEVFRRPQTALLPFADEPSARRLVTFALVVGLYLVALRLDDSPHSGLAAIGFVSMVGVVAILPRAGDRPGRRAALYAVLAAAMGVFAASRSALWLASVPILWASLAALDDVAVLRARGGGTGRVRSAAAVDAAADAEMPPDERPIWSAFGPIAAGALVSVPLIALARVFA